MTAVNARRIGKAGWMLAMAMSFSGCGGQIALSAESDGKVFGYPEALPPATPSTPPAQGLATLATELVAAEGPYLFFAGCFEENSLCFSFPNRIGCDEVEIVFEKTGQVCAVCTTEGEKTFHCGLADGEAVKQAFAQVSADAISLAFFSHPGLRYADCADPAGCPVLPNQKGCERLAITLSLTEPPASACQVKNALPVELTPDALPVRCSAGASNRHCEDLFKLVLLGDAGQSGPAHAQLNQASGELRAMFDKLINAPGAYAKANQGGDVLQGFMKLVNDIYTGFVAAWPMIIKVSEWGLTIATPVLGTVCQALNGVDYGITCIVASCLGVAAQVLPFLE